VTSAKIQGVKKFSRGGLWGHQFDAHAELSYLLSKKEEDCSLVWDERSSTVLPAFAVNVGAIIGQWNDMFPLLPASPTFAPWRKRTKKCPGSDSVDLTDIPSQGPRITTNTLEFRIRFKSALNCDCKIASITLFAKQVLTNGWIVDTREFIVGRPSIQYTQ
jgi:hypothetical protein